MSASCGITRQQNVEGCGRVHDERPAVGSEKDPVARLETALVTDGRR
ncbi:hypothetical protein [Kibdelosporangium aridum]